MCLYQAKVVINLFVLGDGKKRDDVRSTPKRGAEGALIDRQSIITTTVASSRLASDLTVKVFLSVNEGYLMPKERLYSVPCCITLTKPSSLTHYLKRSGKQAVISSGISPLLLTPTKMYMDARLSCEYQQSLVARQGTWFISSRTFKDYVGIVTSRKNTRWL